MRMYRFHFRLEQFRAAAERPEFAPEIGHHGEDRGELDDDDERVVKRVVARQFHILVDEESCGPCCSHGMNSVARFHDAQKNGFQKTYYHDTLDSCSALSICPARLATGSRSN